jgi:regulator of protease activity HflC (stomatin/prohibitin superfamily)
MDTDPTVIEINPEPPPPARRSWGVAIAQWWQSKWRDLRGPFWIVALLALFLTGWLFDSIFINVYPGHAGVLWRRFSGGTDLKHVYGGGLWIINPFNRFYDYETRLQQRETEFTALSTNGLTLNIRASVRFRPIVKDLPLLHEEVGPEYIERVVIHQTQSIIRKVIGTYSPDQLYGSQGNILQNVVFTAMAELRARHIELDDLLIREVRLPPKMANAIENKLEQEQIALQFDYILVRERKEADRKKIEAEGILQFQRTVAQSLDEKYLKLRGIEASLALAKSPNSKVVLFGQGPGGLPLILNMADTPAPGAPPASVVPSTPSVPPADEASSAPPSAPPSPAPAPLPEPRP